MYVTLPINPPSPRYDPRRLGRPSFPPLTIKTKHRKYTKVIRAIGMCYIETVQPERSRVPSVHHIWYYHCPHQPLVAALVGGEYPPFWNLSPPSKLIYPHFTNMLVTGDISGIFISGDDRCKPIVIIITYSGLTPTIHRSQ